MSEHKCPSEPCEACWNEARSAGFVIVIFGLITLFMLFGTGCASWKTGDCKRGDDNLWHCTHYDKEVRNR